MQGTEGRNFLGWASFGTANSLDKKIKSMPKKKDSRRIFSVSTEETSTFYYNEIALYIRDQRELLIGRL